MSDKKLENGYKKITPAHNPKPFQKGHTYRLVYTEEKLNELLDELESWLIDEEPEYDDDGEIIGYKPNKNVFFSHFLAKKRLTNVWIQRYSQKYDWFKERMEVIKELQEVKLQELAIKGHIKENFTKFVLVNRYKWADKQVVENNVNIEKKINLEDLIEFDDESKD